MGYYAAIHKNNISLSENRLNNALEAFRELCEKDRHFSWVDKRAVEQALENPNKVLAVTACFREWGYEMAPHEENVFCRLRDGIDAVLYLLHREREKWGDDETLWETLARHSAIDESCYIRFRGEDGCLWGYRFQPAGTLNKDFVVGGFLYETASITWKPAT